MGISHLSLQIKVGATTTILDQSMCHGQQRLPEMRLQFPLAMLVTLSQNGLSKMSPEFTLPSDN